jgi:tetratricopeptide (TPR) repeat protein
VTVLFAGVANYTALSEQLGPEEIHQIMEGCFQILADAIHRHEGTINQFTGDGVMALFGAPVAHEDHAQRACHAALAIQQAMEAFGEKIQREHGVDFQMRIGLNSGPLIVGSIGDDLRTLGAVEQNYGWHYLAQGNGELVARHSRSAIKYHEESQVLISLPSDWMLLGAAHYLLGDLATAREYLEKAAKMATDAGLRTHLAFAYYVQSLTHFDLGDTEWALKRMEEASNHSEQLAQKHFAGICRIGLGRMMAEIDPSKRGPAVDSIRQGIRHSPPLTSARPPAILHETA